jgi:5'-nucleotidase
MSRRFALAAAVLGLVVFAGCSGDDGEDGFNPLLVNAAPTANADTASSDYEGSVTIDVLRNDTDPDRDALSIRPGSVTNPPHGTAVLNGNNTIEYMPDAGFHGVDTFRYTCRDAWGAEDGATVTVNVSYRVTVLHNNDGESRLLNAGTGLEDFGGIHYFKDQVDRWKAWADMNTAGAVMLSSGDNSLAGKEWQASVNDGTYYDAIGLAKLGYDAICLGNHDFDFGPDVLTDFIAEYDSAGGTAPFLSANIDFSGEAGLQAHFTAGRIAKSVVVTRQGEQIGIVGATTERLKSISSPGNVTVDPDVALAIQGEIDVLTSAGVNKIVVISHLQGLDEDRALAPQLRGVDVMIAGGGDEILAHIDDLLLPEARIEGPYPIEAKDAQGNTVLIVTGEGDYRYVGALIVDFDPQGRVVGYDHVSGPKRVTKFDGLAADAEVKEEVVDPVQGFVDDLENIKVATSEVSLDAIKSNIRSRETNEGNLVADAMLWQADRLHAGFGVPKPMVGLANGGGIRNNSIIPPGDLTLADTFTILAFTTNKVTVVSVTRDTFKQILENAVSRLPGSSGRFAQISGFTMEVDTSRQARVIDSVSKQETTPGERVRNVELDDGTDIVVNGVVQAGGDIVIATNDFLVRPKDGTPTAIVGGDEYPFGANPDFAIMGVDYRQALQNYLEASTADGGLGGEIDSGDARYNNVLGEGRITFVP